MEDVADGDDTTCLEEEENVDEEEVEGASNERNIELFDLVTVTDAVCLELEDVEEEEEEEFEDVLLNGFCSNAVRIF